jgi:hypothetical protein
MIAKAILAASLCFAFFVIPHFWQQDTHYAVCLSTLSSKIDTIFNKNHQYLSLEIEKGINYNPKFSSYKFKNDTLNIYLDPLNIFLDKKINAHQGLSKQDIDSINGLRIRFKTTFFRFLDEQDRKDYETKISSFTLPDSDSKLSTDLQHLRLISFKQHINVDAFIFQYYCLDKCSFSCGSHHLDKKYFPYFYRKTFAEKKVQGDVVLIERQMRHNRDSIWVNGILGNHYEFIPRKTGYHYFCVKVKMTAEKGTETVLRDTFKVHITK